MDTLFADCVQDNHRECLRTFPDFDLSHDPPRRTGELLVCSCTCHVKRLCAKDGYVLQLLADLSGGCGYWCPACESMYDEDHPDVITETEAEG